MKRTPTYIELDYVEQLQLEVLLKRQVPEIDSKIHPPQNH